MYFFLDRKFRLARVWSNGELKKFAHLYEGDIINVSADRDLDKEGSKYCRYFKKANSYEISNFSTATRGYRGVDSEILLNLEDNLPPKLFNKYQVVFNHTTLEHIFNIEKSFSNLCLMSNDTVIIVVPFLQPMHGETFGDYWRFTPTCILKMFNKNGFELIYLSFNDHAKSSIYIFAIGSKKSSKWIENVKYFSLINEKNINIKNRRKFRLINDNFPNNIGNNFISNFYYSILRKFNF